MMRTGRPVADAGRSVALVGAVLRLAATCATVLACVPAGCPPTGAEVIARLQALAGRVDDLRCTADVEMAFARDPNVRLSVEYVVRPPGRMKFTIESRSAKEDAYDEFRYKVGLICVVADQKLAIWNPSTLTVTEVDLGATDVIDDSFAHHGTAAIPGVGPYVQGMYYLSRKGNFDIRLVDDQVLDGTPAYLLELAAKRPTKPGEPWTVAREKLWVDRERLVPLKSEALSPDGKLVSTTTYGDFRQVAHGQWVPLTSQTRIEPGAVHVVTPVLVQRGQEPRMLETWEGDTPYGGRVVQREWQWFNNQILVPDRVEVSDLDGNMLSRAVFRDYLLDTGVLDSEFSLPPADQ